MLRAKTRNRRTDEKPRQDLGGYAASRRTIFVHNGLLGRMGTALLAVSLTAFAAAAASDPAMDSHGAPSWSWRQGDAPSVSGVFQAENHKSAMRILVSATSFHLFSRTTPAPGTSSSYRMALPTPSLREVTSF